MHQPYDFGLLKQDGTEQDERLDMPFRLEASTLPPRPSMAAAFRPSSYESVDWDAESSQDSETDRKDRIKGLLIKPNDQASDWDQMSIVSISSAVITSDDDDDDTEIVKHESVMIDLTVNDMDSDGR